MNTTELAEHFIKQVWNNKNFEQLDALLHPGFKDHSLPPALPSDKAGLISWVQATGASFEHRTHIESQVTEGDTSIVKVRMFLKHTGTWRGIEPTGLEVQAIGYRQFRTEQGRIIEHWGLIDGQAIENQLKQASHGCKIGE